MKSSSFSIGCEYFPKLGKEIHSLVQNGFCDHVQITVPNKWHIEAFDNSPENCELFLHSNLLNTFGQNNWNELRIIAPQLRARSKSYVIEHFTAFRPDECTKSAIYFSPELASGSKKAKVFDNLLRWQEMLGIPITLENIPLTDHVDVYFDFLMECCVRTGCQIACDLPHFFISMQSANKTEDQMKQRAKDLNPIHLHVGGVSLTDGKLRDNHYILSPWIINIAYEYFKNARYMTLEQNGIIPLEVIKQHLSFMRHPTSEKFPAQFFGVRGVEQEQFNDELCQEVAKVELYSDPIRVLSPLPRSSEVEQNPVSGRSALDIYDKYTAFLWPLKTLHHMFHLYPKERMLSLLVLVARRSLGMLSWWLPQIPRFFILTYGEEGLLPYQVVIAEQGSSEAGQTAESLRVGPIQKIRFESNLGYWVELEGPAVTQF